MRELGVVFDMDDTLYFERDYVRSGFQYVAATVASHDTSLKHARDAFGLMWGLFEAGARGTTFNDLLERYPDLAEIYTVADLVTLYREHPPTINLMPEMEGVLLELQARAIPLGVITDGPLVSQRAKADALHLERYAGSVILTDTWGQDFWKPHLRAFEETSRALNLPPENLIYIGDNPGKDFDAPAQLGWRSVRLRLPEQLRFEHDHGAYKPTLEVASVAELRAFFQAQLAC